MVKKSACNVGGPGLIPGLGRSPWRRIWDPTPIFLPGESHGQESLTQATVCGVEKESDMTHELTSVF